MSVQTHATVFQCDGKECDEIYIHAPTLMGAITPIPDGWWELADSDQTTTQYVFCSTRCLSKKVSELNAKRISEDRREHIRWEQRIANT